MEFLSYLFWPNPGNADYSNPKVIALLILCALLVLGSFIVRRWRAGIVNPMTKKLSRSWSGAMAWFGIAGLIMVVSRVEDIQFLAMRFLWVLWGLIALAYVLIQLRLFRARHYEVLPKETVIDPRDKYLPGKRRK